MNSDGKIYIYISDTLPEQSGEPKEKKPKKTDAEKTSEFIKHEFHNFIENQAKQFVNYSISNIGNFTGNYLAQANTQAAISIANTLKNIGISAKVGFEAGGVYGAIVGVGLAITTQAINYGYGEFSANYQIKKQNREINIMRDRVGLNTLTNGSR